MYTIEQVNERLKSAKVHEEVTFDKEIDVSKCYELFGYRCPHNIHVHYDKKTAHKDFENAADRPIIHAFIDFNIIGNAIQGIISGQVCKLFI